MITLTQYFGVWWGHKDHTAQRTENAHDLLDACGKLEKKLVERGIKFPINPTTHSEVSGATYGGFRPKGCPVGKNTSAHTEGLAVDRYDPLDKIDDYLLAHPELLEECGVYIEHPAKTTGWSHWTIRAPKSGKRIFYP